MQEEIQQLSSFGLLRCGVEEIAKPTLKKIRARQEVKTPSEGLKSWLLDSFMYPPRGYGRVNNLTISLNLVTSGLGQSYPPLKAPLQQHFISLDKNEGFVWSMAFYFSYFSVKSLPVNIIQ